MATFTRTRLVAVVVVLLVPAVLYPLVGLWSLVWLPVALMLLGVALARPAVLAESGSALVRALSGAAPEAAPRPGESEEPRDRSGQGDEPEPVSAPRGENGTRGVRLRRTALPSAEDDYEFVFSARVHWRWAGRIDLRLRNPAGPASYSVLLRAREILARTRPEDRGVVEVELNALFAAESPVADGAVEVWADDLRVDLADEDEERLRRIVHLRKDRALWEAEHEAEAVRAVLRDIPASGPGPAPAPPPGPAPSPGPSPAPATAPEESAEELSGQIIEHFEHPIAGSGVDDDGYESYWWPADPGEDEAAMQQDVQVAILRGMIESVPGESERAAFVREQVHILERSGLAHVAERIQSVYPDH
ncbi:hypothetical protein [Nocardiopsis sp. JB363]|uniref:hypothetical protein n=1 Tax=Nocardiopsis sp. JB363 TaxID=1434837 RepID=UPI00097B0734|nr:hypothetical protein [Nocardiopsis sp. JB363]SIO90039.1 hypothetical protein BQ8420_24650 [Nocardiopsis sp. JB363]